MCLPQRNLGLCLSFYYLSQSVHVHWSQINEHYFYSSNNTLSMFHRVLAFYLFFLNNIFCQITGSAYLQINDELIILLSLATVTSLRARSIDCLVCFCINLSFNRVTGESTSYLPCKTETEAGNTIPHEEEAVG